MLMQIDANAVALYMQISHATTLRLFFWDIGTLLSVCFVDAYVISLCLGVCLAVFV